MEIRTLDVAELFTRRFIRAGEDVEIEEAEVPYEMLKILGYGGHGLVEQVQDVTTGTCYARKTFRVDRGPIKDAKKMLYNEVQVIRDLAPHPHVIRVHATYIAGRTLAIVLDPVADGGDLAKYLAYYRDLPETHAGKNEGRRILCRAFGCLAHTLAYIHSDQLSHKPVIRHKDIKPKNILIHQGFPILTDFGISKRCIENVTTTGGRPQAFSAFYCAPEVADYDDRNRSADIFSLGCVFLEMVMALYPDDFEDISLAVIDGPYHTQIESICLSLSNSSIPSLAKVISYMLSRDPAARPSARQTKSLIDDVSVYLPCDQCHKFSEQLSLKAEESRQSTGATQSAPPTVQQQPRPPEPTEEKPKIKHSGRKHHKVPSESRLHLESQFSKNPYPSYDEIDIIAKKVNLDTKRVRAWFSNKRARGMAITRTDAGHSSGSVLLAAGAEDGRVDLTQLLPHVSSYAVDSVFSAAITIASKVWSGAQRPPMETRMKLYGLYKQAMEGDIPMARSELTSGPEARSALEKWEAWHRLEGTPRTEAKARYISLLIDTLHKYGPSGLKVRELIDELETVWNQVV